MGLFSFLTGRSGDDATKTADAPAAAPAVEPAAPAAPAGAAPVPSSGAEAPVPPAEPAVSAAPEEPKGWDLDTGALTAPPAPKPSTDPVVGPPDADLTAALQGPIIEVIKTVYDPEIPVDVYELGLIYDIIVDEQRQVLVKMTLTSPACPSAQQLPSEVRYKIKALPEVSDAVVEIVWEPPWDKERMSEAAKLQLGFF